MNSDVNPDASFERNTRRATRRVALGHQLLRQRTHVLQPSQRTWRLRTAGVRCHRPRPLRLRVAFCGCSGSGGMWGSHPMQSVSHDLPRPCRMGDFCVSPPPTCRCSAAITQKLASQGGGMTPAVCFNPNVARYGGSALKAGYVGSLSPVICIALL